ncbi:MAG: UDP-N-acetylglucosamine 1-carboxyvinyltransferase [Deltaproteobacteria bacterium]|jgi:UDP-N-acetylglucosamine 1-carboxyvinyltransferase|nr:UDP-N-acetylglucosamine 1-carboxyvinyltransferase [Deltaproteobacteria bacterium]
MDKLIVEGGQSLAGVVRVSGAKNAVLPLMAASILTDDILVLTNVPNLGDVRTMGRLLRHMGGQAALYPQIGGGEVKEEAVISMGSLSKPEAPHELVKTMRASALVLGPLLARHGRAKVSLPGGCAIGVRPMDLHLKALSQMGAEFDLSGGDIVGRAPDGGLQGANLRFETVTVTGTENVMMAAVVAKGRTVIANAAREPEVTDTARALIAMGANIEGLDTDTLVIDGVESLNGAVHRVIADRIEAGTLLAAVALAGGRCRVIGAPVGEMATVLDKLSEAGAKIEISRDSAAGTGGGEVTRCPYDAADLVVEVEPGGLTATGITTGPHPGFPTDMQAQFMAMMTTARGTSIITETIFENRFMHVAELRRLGADITLEGRSAVIKGVSGLSGAPMTASDLRASASLILAAMAAKGVSEIFRVYHLDRGYDGLDAKLINLGANIKRVPVK